MAEKGYLGVTPPISVAQSTDREREITGSLMEELRRQNSFESEEESRRRELVLGRVAALVKKFVRDISIAKGLSETAANAAGGKIFTFGSYRLGVHSPGSDIDTCCVVPKHVTREDFFNVFEPMVKALEGATEVSARPGVPDAFVPVIGANISGISMDLLIAPLGMSSIPEDLSLKDNNLLRNLDESVVRSVNGTRLTDELLRLVPNVQVFRDALRCIKLWAQRKAIYSNKIGYLGGVAWAMLVARICQLYPNAVAGAIVSRFFTVMSKWYFPPLNISGISITTQAMAAACALKADRRRSITSEGLEPQSFELYPSDRAHLMPIITPNYPSMCATHNVSRSTHAIMVEAIEQGECRAVSITVDAIRRSCRQHKRLGAFIFPHFITTLDTCLSPSFYSHLLLLLTHVLRTGAQLLDKVLAGDANWAELFTKHDFFHRYKHYIQIVAMTRDKQAQVKWSGTVESKMRHLVGRLEFVDNLRLPHPFAKGFDRVVRCVDEAQVNAVLRGEEAAGPDAEGDVNDEAYSGADHKVFLSSFFIGLRIRPLEEKETIARRLDMGVPIADFTKMVKGDAFDEANMGITLRHLRRTALPGYVFDAGEKEAQQALKVLGKRTRLSSAGETPVVKRSRLVAATA
ncbi:hypothetical protein MIND_00294700 [Mycena indigotica]|uniref:Poly(A) polymerase n=1 Tax=Mycena indigotica TaxID=2126181 RepID=A0A8H6T1L4_9AGAR|nr:uncharacterized protein MIND_00294700 [Mycena indigotica]KAF7309244.1 hypothetical protein MIND_00294700 [Mycena indigotica]